MDDEKSEGMTSQPADDDFSGIALAQEPDVMVIPAYVALFGGAERRDTDEVYAMHATCPDVMIRDHDLFGTLDHVVTALATCQQFIGSLLLTMHENPEMSTPEAQDEMANRYEVARLAHHVMRGLYEGAHLQHHAQGTLSRGEMAFAMNMRKTVATGNFSFLTDLIDEPSVEDTPIPSDRPDPPRTGMYL